MPDEYYNPYRNTSTSNRYLNLGSGYYQDTTTGQVKRRNNNLQYRDVEDPTENLYEKKFAKANQFKRELSTYDQAAQQFKEDSLRSFLTSSEHQGARNAAGIAMSAGQFAQRRGLGDEFTAALTAEQQGRAQQQITGANLDFESKLTQLLGSERIGFIKGEFDFFHRLQAMDYANELSKDLAKFQAELANNYSLQQAFGDLLQVGGMVIGGMIGGPGGAAAGGMIAGGALQDQMFIGPRNF